MWDLDSTALLLKNMSTSTEPGELVWLFFEHIRQAVDMRRALVLNHAGLEAPQYRLVHDVQCGRAAAGSVATLDEPRRGGLLARLLYLGELQNIADFSPQPSDPAFDLLQDSRSLMAFPLFDQGISSGMVVVLGSSPRHHKPVDLWALAMASSLLGRAIESQKLADQLRLACRALDNELRAAADVQRWLLPALPKLDDTAIAASYRPARYSGGDYFDVARLRDGRLGILIADVSGKGAAAAVLMAVMRSIVRDKVASAELPGPAALLDYAESRLCDLGLSERCAFITAFCGVLNPATGELIYSCAGHEPPRLLRGPARTVTSLDGARTFPLGILPEPNIHGEERAVLEPGDLALFYTDGVTDARSPGGDFFGVDRVDRILRDLPEPLTPDAAVQAISQAVGAFEGTRSQTDDETLLAIAGRFR